MEHTEIKPTKGNTEVNIQRKIQGYMADSFDSGERTAIYNITLHPPDDTWRRTFNGWAAHIRDKHREKPNWADGYISEYAKHRAQKANMKTLNDIRDQRKLRKETIISKRDLNKRPEQTIMMKWMLNLICLSLMACFPEPEPLDPGDGFDALLVTMPDGGTIPDSGTMSNCSCPPLLIEGIDMTLPLVKFTYSPLTQVPSSNLNDIQDAVISLERPHITPIDGNIRVVTGSASWIGGVLVSMADANAYHVALNGLRADPLGEIKIIRARIDQLGVDRLDMTLWEVDDTVNAPGTAVATVQSDGTTGAKWLTLNVNRPLLSGYSWYIRLDHVLNGGPSNINISMLETFTSEI